MKLVVTCTWSSKGHTRVACRLILMCSICIATYGMSVASIHTESTDSVIRLIYFQKEGDEITHAVVCRFSTSRMYLRYKTLMAGETFLPNFVEL